LKSETRDNLRDALVLVCLSAVMLAICCVHEFRALGGPGPTLDDTFIHLRFASNLARGHGFSFNPGQQLPGSTSPLWVLILTPFASGSKEFMVGASLVLSSLSYLPLGVLAWMLARRLGASRAIGLTAGALVALNGRLLWAGMSGMETDLFAALSMLGFIVYLGEQKDGRMSWRAGLILGLAVGARPEGYMLFIGVVIHHLLSRAREDGFSRRAMLGAVPWAAIVVFAALIAPYIIFSVATSGGPLPTTFAAKSVDFAWLRGRYVRFTALYFWLDNPGAALIIVPAAALAAVRIFRERLGFLASGDGLVAGWALGYLAVSILMTPMPFHFCRYQIPVLPFFLIVCARAGEWAVSMASKNEGERGTWIPMAASALLLIGALAGQVSVHKGGIIPRWPVITTRSAKNIREMHVKVGTWLGRATRDGDVIATMDIGAIGFYSEREIIDLIGLVTPEITDVVRGKGGGGQRSKAIHEFLETRQPDYLAVFPDMYPGLLDDQRAYRYLFEVKLDDNQIAAHDRMVIFHCWWGPR